MLLDMDILAERDLAVDYRTEKHTKKSDLFQAESNEIMLSKHVRSSSTGNNSEV